MQNWRMFILDVIKQDYAHIHMYSSYLYFALFFLSGC